MRVRIKIDLPKMQVDEEITVKDTAELTKIAQERVAKAVGWPASSYVKRMNQQKFMAKVVNRYNKAYGKQAPIPTTPDEFVCWAVVEGIVTMMEEEDGETTSKGS